MPENFVTPDVWICSVLEQHPHCGVMPSTCSMVHWCNRLHRCISSLYDVWGRILNNIVIKLYMCARACNRQHCIETTAGIERGCGCMRGRRTRFVPPPRSFSVRILEPRLFFLFFFSQHVDRIDILTSMERRRYCGILGSASCLRRSSTILRLPQVAATANGSMSGSSLAGMSGSAPF